MYLFKSGYAATFAGPKDASYLLVKIFCIEMTVKNTFKDILVKILERRCQAQ